MAIIHPIPPVFDEHSEILILGSFPSVKSREAAFFYGHPQNRFWRVLAAVFGTDAPQTVPEKKRFLLERRLALWDVIAACDVTGSADGSIKNAVLNDLSPILEAAPIRLIVTNGKTADRLFDRFFGATAQIPKINLPSTSPANAAWSLERLTEAWRCVTE